MTFKKGNIPWNKNRKCPEISRSKKGNLTWNKGLRGIKTSNKGQINLRKLPRKILKCKICGKEIEVRVDKTRKVCSRKCQFIYQKTDEYKTLQRERSYKRNKNPIISSPEKFLEFMLKANDIKYNKGKYIYGNPDFIINKTCIFLDGEYWHNYPKRRKKDILINKKLKKLGYKILRFWVDHEFYKNPTKCLLKMKI